MTVLRRPEKGTHGVKDWTIFGASLNLVRYKRLKNNLLECEFGGYLNAIIPVLRCAH